MIQSTGLQQTTNPQIYNQYPARDVYARQEQGQADVSERLIASNDKVSLTYSSESVLTYSSYMTLQGGKNDGFDLLRGLVMNMLKEQGVDTKIATDCGEIDLEQLSLRKMPRRS